MMVITTLPNHFAVELVGGRRNNRPLKVVQRKLDDQDLYFGQFSYPPSMKAGTDLGVQVGGYKNITFATSSTKIELERRFPKFSDMYPTKVSFEGQHFGAAIGFPKHAKYFCADNILIANAFDGMVRIRHINFALIISKENTIEEYQAYLKQELTIKDKADIVAMRFISNGKSKAIFQGTQFANMFLMNGLHETSIGSFIDQHREIFLSAFEARQIVSEPYLTWMVPSPDPDEHAINPDLFVQRADGYWDVYDLKLALLNRKTLTTGKRNRRRFVNTIEEGVAQLAHYREFLLIPEHSSLAAEKYGVTFNNPRFVLVVGNYENVDAEKIEDAKRRFPDLELIDYDTLLQLYLIHEGAFLPT